MIKPSILSILLATGASFAIQTDSKISDTDAFSEVLENATSNRSMMNGPVLGRLDLRGPLQTMTSDVQPVQAEISFSAVDGSRPLSPALLGPDLKSTSKTTSEFKKHLPTAYIEKYFE